MNVSPGRRRGSPPPSRLISRRLRAVALATSALLVAEAVVTVGSAGNAVALSRSAPTQSTTTAPAAGQGLAEAQDPASAALAARLQNRRIEVLSARTETSTVWINPDGSTTEDTSSGPVRFRDEAGNWRDIDIDLVRAADGTIEAASHPLDLELAGKTPAAKAARVLASGHEPGHKDTPAVPLLSLTSDDGRPMTLSWRGSLPQPVLDGTRARYVDALTATDLVVETTRTGFEQSLELKDRSAVDANGSVTLTLHTPGLTAKEGDDRSVSFVDTRTGKQAAVLQAPVMWDAHTDPRTGEHTRIADVGLKVTQSGDDVDLTLTPDAEFLAAPDTVFPVTVDPAVNLGTTFDAFVQQGYTTDQSASTELKLGNNGAGQIARSFLQFKTGSVQGRKILGAKLNLWNHHAWTCNSAGSGSWEVWRSGTVNTGSRWTAQPTWMEKFATSTATKGASGCAAGWVSADITSMVQLWADHTATTHHLGIRATDEEKAQGWKRFHSGDAASGTPYISVTYNSYPAKPSGTAISPSTVNAYNGKRYVTSLTPRLSAKLTDPEAGSVKGQFEVTPDPAYKDAGSYTYTATSAAVASGGTASITIPTASAFPAGSHLRYRVRGHDGTVYGDWTGYTAFVMNTGLPAAPRIECEPYAKDTWSDKDPDGAECVLDTTSTDGQGYLWGLDDPKVPNRINDTVDGNGGDPLTITVKPANGWHTLYARTVDSGGNISPGNPAEYAFGVGADGAAVLSPHEGDSTARRYRLAAKGLTSYTGVTWEYRRGPEDPWHVVPAQYVASADGKLSAWPAKVTGGSATGLVWDAAESLASDGVIELRAVFTDGSRKGYSQTVGTTLDRDAGSAPAGAVGPGSLNLLTGNYKLSTTDATAFDTSVARTFSSRKNESEEEGLAQIFGPGWLSSVTAATSGAEYTQLIKSSDTALQLLSADGSSVAFTAVAGGGWKPEKGAESLSLTGGFTGTFTLRDTDANVTVFKRLSEKASNWIVSSSASAVDDSAVVTFSEEISADGRTLSRPRSVVSPNEAVPADVCRTTPSTKGCRVIEFVYAGETKAAGTVLGDYKNQVSSIRLWATDANAAKASEETVARYAYDASGRLRQVWDPRLPLEQRTEYTYDSDGRVRTLNESGRLPWTFTYGSAGPAAIAGEGMLLGASRPALREGSATETSGTAATTIVYGVPLSGARAPHAMNQTAVAAWGQDAAPTDATAIFPPGTAPGSSNGEDLSKDAYQHASISYIDANGQETNTAEPGGAITTTEYDEYGHTVAELSAGNRALALGTTATAADTLASLGLAELGTAERAQRLSTVSSFDPDNQRLTDTYGPVHEIVLVKGVGDVLAPGDTVLARAHTSFRYDEGRPADAAVQDVITSSAVGASIEGFTTDADAVVSRSTYNWSTGEETSSTEDALGAAVTTKSGYTDAGRLITTSLPASNGKDAGTLRYQYYTATGTGPCAGRPEWAGLLCRTEPAAAITNGGANPNALATTVYTYNRWGGQATRTESVGSATRKVTVEYDKAGRVVASGVSGEGEAVPDTLTTYDAVSGQIASKSSGGRTITYRYDALGRVISYSDGAGNTTTTAYDSRDRVTEVTDSAPSSTTYAYDAADRPREITDSVAGTFTAAYDIDGNLTTQTLPGGYTLSVVSNTAGVPVSKEYTTRAGEVVLADSAQFTVHARQAGHTQSDGISIRSQYSYDGVGRLVKAADSTADSCVSRDYEFDANSNRTKLTTRSDDCDSTTDDTRTEMVPYAYDSADRLTGGARTYDAFGRTLTSGGTELSYFVNNLVRTETSGERRKVWDLDAAGRLGRSQDRTRTADGTWAAGDTVVNHYSDNEDSPSWSRTGDTISRNVEDLTGNLGAITAADGDVVLQLTNLHGDVGVQLPLDPTQVPSVLRYDEYGNPLLNTASAQYGWLGGAQVESDTLGGYVRMGVRLYEPGTGRFLQQDPEYGGGANAYVYCDGDGVNCQDVDGFASYYLNYDLGKTAASDKSVFNYWKSHFKSIFPIPGRPGKITKKGQKFTLRPVVAGISMYFPVKVNSITKSYLQLGARPGHPDWPGGWIGFDLFKKKGRMKLEVRGYLGGLAAIANRSFNQARAKPYWDKLAKNLRNTVKKKF
ncbi:DNRLRE domain-containing protein [Streptomyces sp. NPDC088846]|uniref:DNRLRE domain-containing protein n=1 Tax=Streptomyces sp. NPDC088846 TaxID=3365908 RepID=UPI0038014ECB